MNYIAQYQPDKGHIIFRQINEVDGLQLMRNGPYPGTSIVNDDDIEKILAESKLRLTEMEDFRYDDTSETLPPLKVLKIIDVNVEAEILVKAYVARIGQTITKILPARLACVFRDFDFGVQILDTGLHPIFPRDKPKAE